MGTPLVVWGASGHARVVADIIRLSKEYDIVGFLDDVNSFSSFIWSSFDGTTNAPAIYPHYPGTPDLTVRDLQTWVLSTH